MGCGGRSSGTGRTARERRPDRRVHRAARSGEPAGGITIAEVEELVEPGEIPPDQVHTPGVFVQRVVALTGEQAAEKRIERRTVSTAKEA